jgi:3-mercaptopyruvate sulfurtransferase SseA
LPEVNTTELRAALENASAVVPDARPYDEYAGTLREAIREHGEVASLPNESILKNH